MVSLFDDGWSVLSSGARPDSTSSPDTPVSLPAGYKETAERIAIRWFFPVELYKPTDRPAEAPVRDLTANEKRAWDKRAEQFMITNGMM